MLDYYKVLGVTHDASTEEVTHAFKMLAKLTHPDALPGISDEEKIVAEERFKVINEAHDTLKDEGKRAAYNQTAPAGPFYARRMALLAQKFEAAVLRIVDSPYFYVDDPIPHMERVLIEDRASRNSHLMMLQEQRGRVAHFRGRMLRRDGAAVHNDAFERTLYQRDRDLAGRTSTKRRHAHLGTQVRDH